MESKVNEQELENEIQKNESIEKIEKIEKVEEINISNILEHQEIFLQTSEKIEDILTQEQEELLSYKIFNSLLNHSLNFETISKWLLLERENEETRFRNLEQFEKIQTILEKKKLSSFQFSFFIQEYLRKRFSLFLEPKKDNTKSNSPVVVFIGFTPPKPSPSLNKIKSLEVNYKSSLKWFAQLYSFLILHKLLPIKTELDFIVRVITLQSFPSLPSSPSNSSNISLSEITNLSNEILKTSDEWFYFISRVLDKLKPLVIHLGPQILKLLTKNQILQHFSPKLVNIFRQVPDHLTEKFSSSSSKFSNETVSVPPDSKNKFKTKADKNIYDNRENRRDAFYDLKRNFTNFSVQQSSEFNHFLKNLFPQNYSWFALLFQSEVLKLYSVSEDFLDPSMKQLADSEKLRKLNERFNPVSSISQQEEFLLKLIEAIQDHSLIVHLIRALLSKLLILSSLKHGASTLQINDFQNGQQMAERILQLKTLAKFLAYLLLVPNNPKYLPESENFSPSIEDLVNIENICIENNCKFLLDISNLIHLSINNGTLTINLPWILQYLLILYKNPILVKTNYFSDSLRLLKNLYHSVFLRIDDPLKKNFGINQIYIQLELEQFFETIHESLRIHFQVSCNLPSKIQFHSSMIDFSFLLIDHSFIKICCPFLQELQITLNKAKISSPTVSSSSSSSSSTQTFNKPTVRKIVPKAVSSSYMNGDKENQSQKQLRQLFFLSQPQLQQISDFVCDKIINNAIAEIMENVTSIAEGFVLPKTLDFTNIEKEEENTVLLKNIIEKLQTDSISESIIFTKKFCSEKIPLSITSLSSLASDNRFLQVAIHLTKEKAIETINQTVPDKIKLKIKQIIESKINTNTKTKKSSKESASPSEVNKVKTIYEETLDIPTINTTQKKLFPVDIHRIGSSFQYLVSKALKSIAVSCLDSEDCKIDWKKISRNATPIVCLLHSHLPQMKMEMKNKLNFDYLIQFTFWIFFWVRESNSNLDFISKISIEQSIQSLQNKENSKDSSLDSIVVLLLSFWKELFSENIEIEHIQNCPILLLRYFIIRIWKPNHKNPNFLKNVTLQSKWWNDGFGFFFSLFLQIQNFPLSLLEDFFLNFLMSARKEDSDLTQPLEQVLLDVSWSIFYNLKKSSAGKEILFFRWTQHVLVGTKSLVSELDSFRNWKESYEKLTQNNKDVFHF